MLSTQVGQVILGLLLATLTAVGCIAYEKIVKSCSIGLLALIPFLFLLPIVLINLPKIKTDIGEVLKSKELIVSTIIYIISCTVMPLWYIVTKKQGVMAGSAYEVNYVVILAVIYIMLGEKQINTNLIIGIVLTLGSFYFVSKS